MTIGPKMATHHEMPAMTLPSTPGKSGSRRLAGGSPCSASSFQPSQMLHTKPIENSTSLAMSGAFGPKKSKGGKSLEPSPMTSETRQTGAYW